MAGVPRAAPNQPADMICRELRATGYRVFAVNPAADDVEGDRCYPNLRSLPEAVYGVVIAAPLASMIEGQPLLDGDKRIRMTTAFV